MSLIQKSAYIFVALLILLITVAVASTPSRFVATSFILFLGSMLIIYQVYIVLRDQKQE